MEQIDSTNTACDQLERAVNRIQTLVADHVVAPELAALRARIAGLAERLLQGSDRQTPPQANR